MGRSPVYVSNGESYLRRIITDCEWCFLSDVTAESFTRWRDSQTLAPRTLNHVLAYCNAFLNWLHRRGMLHLNPLRSVGKVSIIGREKRTRRALTDAEVTSLLNVAGPRSLLYKTALLTGLRRTELRSLVWDDFRLDAVRPFVFVRAAVAKNRRAAAIPLRDDLADELCSSRPSNHLGQSRVFVFGSRYMQLLRDDLNAAGIAFEDASGRRVDFHAFRYTFGTNLQRAKVDPATAMKLMRHSDPRLTLKLYTDEVLLPAVDAVQSLPRWGEASTLRIATGTDPAPLASPALSRSVLPSSPLASLNPAHIAPFPFHGGSVCPQRDRPSRMRSTKIPDSSGKAKPDAKRSPKNPGFSRSEAESLTVGRVEGTLCREMGRASLQSLSLCSVSPSLPLMPSSSPRQLLRSPPSAPIVVADSRPLVLGDTSGTHTGTHPLVQSCHSLSPAVVLVEAPTNAIHSVAPSESIKNQRPTSITRSGPNAGELGFEPRQTDPESVVLPLHHSPVGTRSRYCSRERTEQCRPVFICGQGGDADRALLRSHSALRTTPAREQAGSRSHRRGRVRLCRR